MTEKLKEIVRTTYYTIEANNITSFTDKGHLKLALPKTYQKQIKNIEEFEIIDGIKKIFIKDEQKFESEINSIATDITKKIITKYSQELETVYQIGYIRANKDMSIADTKHYLLHSSQEIKDQLFEIGKIIPITFTIKNPEMMMIYRVRFTDGRIDLSTPYNSVLNDIPVFEKIDKQITKEEIALIYLNNFKKPKNISTIEQNQGSQIILSTNSNKKIPSTYFMFDTKNNTELSTHNEERINNIINVITFETTKYLLMPVFYKSMLDSKVLLKDLTNMNKELEAMINDAIKKLEQ